MESVDGITCGQCGMVTIFFSRVDNGLYELYILLYHLFMVFNMLQSKFHVVNAIHVKKRGSFGDILIIIYVFSSIFVASSFIRFYMVDFYSLKKIIWLLFIFFLYTFHDNSIRIFHFGVSFLFFFFRSFC